ncbi:hypothetical protein CDAR_603791 [Caerostris darwini]|uniref:Uncharacterized protein n=1 Tax=Caerostris darwini TaxID=1538125 RepID=A0AAV4T4P6_9ARAC|nr:hypothetical protein CDAR_603791 [Caerostris darwini]
MYTSHQPGAPAVATAKGGKAAMRVNCQLERGRLELGVEMSHIDPNIPKDPRVIHNVWLSIKVATAAAVRQKAPPIEKLLLLCSK